jgi:tetratricopeptide (TPR) repeat protein
LRFYRRSMIPDLAAELMSSWLFWMAMAAGFSLVWLLVTMWLPGARGRRVMEPPRAATVGRSSGDRDAPPLPAEPETALAAAYTVHHDRLVEAHRFLVEARVGTRAERLHSLQRAEQMLDEAMAARPESPDAAELMAHVHYERTRLADAPEEQEEWLRRSAEWFLRATELRPRDVDPYLGAGSAWLELGTRWSGAEALEAYDIAAAAYERAFPEARNNLNLMRGWGHAIDGLHGCRDESGGEARYQARRSAFEAALGEHRGGDHDLHQWFEELLRTDRGGAAG